MCPCLSCVENWTHCAEQRERIPSLILLGIVLSGAARDTTGHLCFKGTAPAPAQLGVHQDPQILFFWALFWLVTPAMFWCLGLFLPRCRTLHLSLLNSVRFLAAHLSSLLTSLWMAAQPAWCISHSSQFSIGYEIFHTHFHVLICVLEPMPWLSDISLFCIRWWKFLVLCSAESVGRFW